jgi:hypothetical protein
MYRHERPRWIVAESLYWQTVGHVVFDPNLDFVALTEIEHCLRNLIRLAAIRTDSDDICRSTIEPSPEFDVEIVSL